MRRLAIALSAALLACGAGSPQPEGRFFPGDTPVPATGPDAPGVEAWDATIVAFMKRWDVPGATLAASVGGRLVVARGYRYADFDAREFMQPATLMRIGSVAKPFTAAALLQLADEGRAGLEAPIASIVDLPVGADARMRSATLRHPLEHAGGWDRKRSGDPISDQCGIAARLGLEGPISPQDMARYALGLPLDFDPGGRFSYSNVGYVALGRAIEQLTSETYEAHVRGSVCAAAGIQAMRMLARAPRTDSSGKPGTTTTRAHPWSSR